MDEIPISSRTDECFQTLRNALMVVVIDLQKDDDPQEIIAEMVALDAESAEILAGIGGML